MATKVGRKFKVSASKFEEWWAAIPLKERKDIKVFWIDQAYPNGNEELCVLKKGPQFTRSSYSIILAPRCSREEFEFSLSEADHIKAFQLIDSCIHRLGKSRFHIKPNWIVETFWRRQDALALLSIEFDSEEEAKACVVDLPFVLEEVTGQEAYSEKVLVGLS